MIRLDLEQNSPEWLMARLGIPTASQFDRIITPKTLKLSAQRFTYRNQLLAEWLLGYPIDWSGSSQFMERGTDMEPQAREWYELQTDAEVIPGGFCLRDDREVGGSPDGLVGDDGLLEIKCPAIHTHIGYMIEPDGLAAAYRHQVQGYLYLTGRAWADVISFNPELPGVIVRVERDEEFTAALGEALDTFVSELIEAKVPLDAHRRARMEALAA